MAKYHIDKHGMPALCTAKSRPCPLGEHFDTEAEAMSYAQNQMQKEFGLLANKEVQVNKMIEDLKAKNDYRKQDYIFRCKSAKRVDRVAPTGKTYHANKDRKSKRERMRRMYGEGQHVGDYLVNHQVGSMRGYRNQYTRVYDNGRIVLYDYNTKAEITSFMAHETRVAAILLRAGEVPDEKLLENAKENYRKESEYYKRTSKK